MAKEADVAKALDLPCVSDFADMSFVKENNAHKILASACDADSLKNEDAFMLCIMRYFFFAILLDAEKAAKLKCILIAGSSDAKAAFKTILGKIMKNASIIDYLNRMKKAVLGRKTEALHEAARLSYTEQEQKMIDWHYGVRKQNVKACTNDKLKLNFDICVERDFLKEGRELFNELQTRSNLMYVPCHTFEGEYLISKYYLPEDCPNTDYAIYSNIALEAKLIALNFNKSGKSDYMQWLAINCDNSYTLIKYLLYALVGAIVRNDNKQKELLTGALTKISGRNPRIDPQQVSKNKKDALQKFINGTLKDADFMAELNKLMKIEKNGLLQESEEIQEDIEKHDELNPKLFDESEKLKPEVRKKLLEIANDFIDKLKEDEIEFELSDVRIVGSNCSYNYNKDSDLDLHLVAKTNSLKCPYDLYPLLYSAYRTI